MGAKGAEAPERHRRAVRPEIGPERDHSGREEHLVVERSLRTNAKTSTPPAAMPGRASGRPTRISERIGPRPSERALSSMLGSIWPNDTRERQHRDRAEEHGVGEDQDHDVAVERTRVLAGRIREGDGRDEVGERERQYVARSRIETVLPRYRVARIAMGSASSSVRIAALIPSPSDVSVAGRRSLIPAAAPALAAGDACSNHRTSAYTGISTLNVASAVNPIAQSAWSCPAHSAPAGVVSRG